MKKYFLTIGMLLAILGMMPSFATIVAIPVKFSVINKNWSAPLTVSFQTDQTVGDFTENWHGAASFVAPGNNSEGFNCYLQSTKEGEALSGSFRVVFTANVSGDANAKNTAAYRVSVSSSSKGGYQFAIQNELNKQGNNSCNFQSGSTACPAPYTGWTCPLITVDCAH